MEKYKTKKVMVEKEEKYDQETVCNCCGKTVAKNGYREKPHYKIVTYTQFWGNDSCDSYEYFDICKECFPKFMQLAYENKLGDKEEGIKTNTGRLTHEYDCIDTEYYS